MSKTDSMCVACLGHGQLGMDGWMTCDFPSFSTVFQSYQDNERSIMKGCVQWSPVYGGEESTVERGLNLVPLDQQASA